MTASGEEPRAAAAAGSNRSACSNLHRFDRSDLWHGLCATTAALAASGSVFLQAAAVALQLITSCLVGLDGLSLTPELLTTALAISRSPLLRLFNRCLPSPCRCVVAALCRHRRRRHIRLARPDRVVDQPARPPSSRGRSPDPDERPRGRSDGDRPRTDRSDDGRPSVDVDGSDDRRQWYGDATTTAVRTLLSGVDGAAFLPLWTLRSRYRQIDGDRVRPRRRAAASAAAKNRPRHR